MSTKSILVLGDLIVQTNGQILRVYLTQDGNKIVSGPESWFTLKGFTDEQLFTHSDCHFHSVWRPKTPRAFGFDKPSHETHHLIWQKSFGKEARLQEVNQKILDYGKIIADLRNEKEKLENERANLRKLGIFGETI